MVEKSSNTMTIMWKSIISVEWNDPSVPPIALPWEVCTRLWELENKIIPNFNLYHMYEVQQSLFLTMVGLDSEDWLTHE